MSLRDPATAPAAPVVIRPDQSWLTFDWRGLVAYRDLLWLLIRRDFVARYKQTVLGPLWYFINPLITTLVFTVVFSRVLEVGTDGVPAPLFYLAGTLLWAYFAAVAGATGNSLSGNVSLFGKVYFPRLIPPLAVAIASLIGVAVQFGSFLAVYLQMLWSGTEGVANPGLSWLLLLPLLAQVGVTALGIGLILSALTAKYRDLHHLQGFLLQTWMYLTPVVYPLSRIPERWRWLAELNPMTPLVEAGRAVLVGAGTFDLGALGQSAALSWSLLVVGVLAYQRTARTFVDTV